MKSEEQPRESGVSSAYGEIAPRVFLALWADPKARRFRYRPIRVATVIMAALLLGLWGYYAYTLAFGAGLSFVTGLFGLLFLLLTAFVGLEVIRWRLFVLRSGVVMTDTVLAWRSGARCYLAPWRLIDPDGLGIGALGFGRDLESRLIIRVDDSAEVLFLVRLFARLEDQEAFLAELLQRIPRENWKTSSAGRD